MRIVRLNRRDELNGINHALHQGLAEFRANLDRLRAKERGRTTAR